MLSRHSSKQPSVPPKQKKVPRSLDHEIIVISDDDDYRPPIRKPKPTKRKTHPFPVDANDDDCVEIVSSEDELIRRRRKLKKADENIDSAGGSGTQAEIKTLRSALGKSERKVAAYLTEIAELEASVRAAKSTNTTLLNPTQLDDEVSCEICTLKNWTPFLLPECGHVFCQTCLRDWFSAALQQHMTTHPNYSLPNRNQLPYNARSLLAQVQSDPENSELRLKLEIELTQHRFVRLQQQGAGMGGDPVYTCPTCRRQVKNRPVEVFPLKAVVRVVAGAMGENSPKKSTAGTRGGKAPATNSDGSWDGFFGQDLGI